MKSDKTIPCTKCTGTMHHSTNYTNRKGVHYEQYYCPGCGKKKSIRTEGQAPALSVMDKISEKNENDGSKSLFGYTSGGKEEEPYAFLKEANVDMDVWEVATWGMESGKWNVAMNLKSGPNNNRVSVAHKETNRKFKIWVKLQPTKGVIDKEKFRRELIEDVRGYSPVVAKIKRNITNKDNHLLMFNLYDLHLDKVAWHEETGHNYDSKIATELAMSAAVDIIGKAQGFNIEKVLIPIGHDFFNSDYSHPFPRTTKGTPQQSDLRWQDAFRKGRQLCMNLIEMFKQVGDVDIVMVPGNHDEERSFYLVDALAMRYYNDENVNVMESPKARKYYTYGDNLIGLAHDGKPANLSSLMALEAPNMWAASKFRYFKLGHLHHEKNFISKSTEDHMGVIIEFLPSITATDAWHFKNEYIGAQRRARGDVFKERDGGQVAQLSYVVPSHLHKGD